MKVREEAEEALRRARFHFGGKSPTDYRAHIWRRRLAHGTEQSVEIPLALDDMDMTARMRLPLSDLPALLAGGLTDEEVAALRWAHEKACWLHRTHRITLHALLKRNGVDA